MSAGEFNHLGNFCFGDLVRKNSADTHTVSMDLQHDLHGFVASLVEKSLQDVHHEFHGRVVVVEEQYLVQARPFGFRPGLGHHTRADPVVLAGIPAIALFFAHSHMLKR